MPEKDQIFKNKVMYTGIANFSDFYLFAYKWLTEEFGVLLSETKYSEKLSGDSKNIEIIWNCSKEITDYFKYEVKIIIKVIGLSKVELTHEGKKIKTNKGAFEIHVTGNLVRDYRGKFEKDGFQKFLRGIYEKMVIPSRVEQFKEQLFKRCEEFLSQLKSYFDIEGKR